MRLNGEKRDEPMDGGPTFALWYSTLSKERTLMNATISRAMMLSCAALVSMFAVHSASAQNCSTVQVQVDSAKDEVSSVLNSTSSLVSEMRQEQHLPATGEIGPISIVRDRTVCAKLATQFDHEIPSSASLVVLRIGPLFYVREPDQKRGTGLITDSTYKVLLRLGASVKD
jgi:hypothetical protein